MHPAFSVIFLTTLIGVGQGLFIALGLGQVVDLADDSFALATDFYAVGGIWVLLFLAAGLLASVFHLGHPERAWRAVACWRTSWLSREVIALPFFMLMAFLYACSYYSEASLQSSLIITLIGLIACFALFICTSMIYQCLTFLREWSTPLTMLNFIFMGSASGFIFASLYASWVGAAELVAVYGPIAVLLTLLAMISRAVVLSRNNKLRVKPVTTVQTATGIQHPKLQQRSMGMMGGSYNTREFVHGQTELVMRNIKKVFMLLGFVIPLLLLLIGVSQDSTLMFFLAFVSQYLGLMAERWHFFAMVNHPQNIYYQTIG
jgi:DMSO reductase anchor subunit